MLAVLDRNELEGEWRNARLLRLEDTNEEVHWRLLTEDGVVIDEPGNGCPAAGFSTGDLLADVGMTSYSLHDAQALSAEVEEREEGEEVVETQEVGPERPMRLEGASPTPLVRVTDNKKQTTVPVPY